MSFDEQYSVPPGAVPPPPPPTAGGDASWQPSPAPDPELAAGVRRTRTGGVWVGLVCAAIVLILLLVFILQNSHNVTIRFFGFHGQLSLAVALLLSSVCGVLLVAIPGTGRIVQLRRAVRKLDKSRRDN